MNQEIMNQQNNSLAMPMAAFGFENILTQDIRIPKLLLVQQMSKMATDEKIQARPGEIRESFEGKLIKQPVQVVPFFTTNTWTISKKINGKYEFAGIEERNAQNITRPYEEEKDGMWYKNERTFNIFCLIRGENLSIPYMVSMKSFSFKFAAQKFISAGALIKAEGKSYANYVFNLTSKKQENDKGIFFIYDIERAVENGAKVMSSPEELAYAYKAYKEISAAYKSGATIDNGNLSDETEVVTESEKF